MHTSNRRRREERQWIVAQRLDRPQCLAPRKPQRRPERFRLGELRDCSGRDAGAAPEIVDRGGLLSGHRG
jgi:hypothetical protein